MSGIIQPPLATRSVVIRRPQADDQGYVCSTWLRNLEPNDRSKWSSINAMINSVIDHASTRLLVACPVDDRRMVLGWIAWGEIGKAKALHYVYVREGRGRDRREGKFKSHRGRGIGRMLIQRAGLEVSRKGADGRALVYTIPGPDVADLLGRFSAVYLPIEQWLK